MFENISFLFLFAMAVLSWAVLCLQHAVEIHRRSAFDYRMEVYTERPMITYEPRLIHQPPEPEPTTGALNFALSFWAILAATFILSKLLQLVEKQVKNYLKSRETLRPANAMESQSLTGNPAEEQMLKPFQQNQQTVDPVVLVVEENAALRDQLNVLETHCLEMRELIDDLRLSKSSSSQSEDEGVVTRSESSLKVRKEAGSLAESVSFPLTPSSSQNSQNIYITNSHIHIRGPIFWSDNNFSTELARQASMYERKPSEFVQVWGKYITSPKERPMIAGSIRCNNILM